MPTSGIRSFNRPTLEEETGEGSNSQPDIPHADVTPPLHDADAESIISSLTDPPSSTPSLSPLLTSPPAKRLEDYANFVSSNRKKKEDLLSRLPTMVDPVERRPLEMQLNELLMVDDLMPELGGPVAWRPKSWDDPIVGLAVSPSPSTEHLPSPALQPRWVPPVDPPEVHFDEKRPYSALLMPKELSDLMQPARKSAERGKKRKFVLHGVPYTALQAVREYVEVRNVLSGIRDNH
jgi:hypothetical protein